MNFKDFSKLIWSLDSYGDFSDYEIHIKCSDSKLRGVDINIGQQTIMLY